jgi:hypothetical protein
VEDGAINPGWDMRRIFSLVLLTLFGSLSSAQTRDDVLKFVNEYSDAYLKEDYTRVAQMTNGALLERIGGQAVAEKRFQDVFLKDRPQHLTAESVRRISWFQGTETKVYLVETERQYRSFPEPLHEDHLYVVVSSNKLPLSMLDLSCISIAWVDMLAPGFKSSDTARDLLARGQINPTETTSNASENPN